MRLLIFICFLLCAVGQVLGANILAVLPTTAKSHFIYTNAVLSALARRGHHVTVISPFTPTKPEPNMKHIEVLKQYLEVVQKSWTLDNGFHAYLMWGDLSYTICEEILNHKEVKKILVSGEKFDLLLGEFLFSQESLLVLGRLLNTPTINFSVCGPWPVINHVHGNHLQISSLPDLMNSFLFSNQMNFDERVRNFMSNIITLYKYYNHHLPKHQDIIQRVFKDPSIPPLGEMVTNISITIANFHPAVGYPQTVPGNIVPSAGIHITAELSPIPKDIQEFLDRGKNSVIYFCMGSMVPSHLMPPELLQIFVKVFSQLPYRVLWKIELESLHNLPKNVKIVSKWLPQQSILAHPNVVLFITHGGFLGQQEAIHAGVPVVANPFFGDHPFNVGVYKHLGLGVGIDFSGITEQSFSKAILRVVGNPSFMENAKRMSAVFRDQPMAPADNVVYWVEYVLRHNGAHHLRPVTATLPWYTIYLLDIVAFIGVALLLILFLLYKNVLLLYSCCRISNANKENASMKKKKK